jgi:hypothetical protein
MKLKSRKGVFCRNRCRINRIVVMAIEAQDSGGERE